MKLSFTVVLGRSRYCSQLFNGGFTSANDESAVERHEQRRYGRHVLAGTKRQN